MKRLLKAVLRTEGEGIRYHRAMIDLLKTVPAGMEGSMIDIGCGDGEKTLEYAQTVSIPKGKIFGIELEPIQLAHARKIFDARAVDLESEKLPWETNSVGLVVCNQVLEHLKNIYWTMSEFSRVVKVGGFLAIGIPNLGSLVNRIWLGLGRQPLCIALPGPHVRSFTHGAFLDFLKLDASFEIVETLGSSLYPFPPPILESGARFAPSLASYTFYLLKKTSHREKSPWLSASESINSTSLAHGGMAPI
jgi:SAM-dependent methyltransferase